MHLSKTLAASELAGSVKYVHDKGGSVSEDEHHMGGPMNVKAKICTIT